MVLFQHRPEPLLTRDAFKISVLSALGGKCAFCPAAAVDAHHILDRKLFEDGGYYRSNGAPLCTRHHWDCETTVLGLAQVRSAAGISQILLPSSLSPAGFGAEFDKWGNRFLSGVWTGYRLAGPLAGDPGMIKALTASGLRSWLLFEPPQENENEMG